jgi:hypothetical protein
MTASIKSYLVYPLCLPARNEFLMIYPGSLIQLESTAMVCGGVKYATCAQRDEMVTWSVYCRIIIISTQILCYIKNES